MAMRPRLAARSRALSRLPIAARTVHRSIAGLMPGMRLRCWPLRELLLRRGLLIAPLVIASTLVPGGLIVSIMRLRIA
jgi:hypothetical protein